MVEPTAARGAIPLAPAADQLDRALEGAIKDLDPDARVADDVAVPEAGVRKLLFAVI